MHKFSVLLVAVSFHFGGGLVQGQESPSLPDHFEPTEIPRVLPGIPLAEPVVEGDFENPPVLMASVLLPAESLAGQHHRVRSTVVTDGYLGHFIIDSDFGTFDCYGVRAVANRLKEIEALAQLAKISKSEVFAEALKKSAKEPVDAVKTLVKDPVGTVKELPSTAGHFLHKVGSAVGKGVKKIGDEISGDPDPSEIAGQAEEVGKGLIGYNRSIATLAQQYGVDPYTDNALLRDKMKEIAWVDFAGGAPIRLGVGAVSAGASAALKVTVATGLPEVVYELTPSEILVRNRAVMTKFGVPDATRDAFEANPVLSPSLSLSFLSTLDSLGVVEGSGAVVEVAAGLPDRRKIEFLIWSVGILASAEERLVRLHQVGPLPAGETGDGRLLVPAAVDYVSWTERVSGFVGNPELEGKKVTLILGGGKVSDAARKGITAAGWELR